MKNLLIALCTSVFLVACGGKEAPKEVQTTTPEVVGPVVPEKVRFRVAQIPTHFSCADNNKTPILGYGSTTKFINSHMAVMQMGGVDYMGQLYADGSYFVHEITRENMMPSATKIVVYGEFVEIGKNQNMETFYSVDVKINNTPFMKMNCVVPRYAQWKTFDPNPKEEVVIEKKVEPVVEKVDTIKPVEVVAEVVEPAMPVKASFSCEGKLSLVEQLICDTPELSMKDAELAIAYREARKNGDEAAVKSQQRVWMKQRNNCTTAACVHDAYKTRLKELSQ